MNLFIDNSSERAAVFYNRVPNNIKFNTVWAKTAEEAISFFNFDYSLNTVWLEHDLDIGQLNYDSPISGMEVIRWFEKCDYLNKFENTEFIIHTNNIPAGNVMLKRLLKLNLNVKFQPFGLLF